MQEGCRNCWVWAGCKEMDPKSGGWTSILKHDVFLHRHLCSEMLEGELEHFSHVKFNTTSFCLFFPLNKYSSSTFQDLGTVFIAGDPAVNKSSPAFPVYAFWGTHWVWKTSWIKKKKTYYTFCLTSFEEKKKSLQCSLSCLCWNVNVTICLGEKAWKKQLG